MEMQEVISRAERNIRQALRDYGAHTSQTDVLDDVTDEFIYRLAADSSYAKQGLRKLFSKSPVWNEELESVRAEMGDAGISMLCQSEFGDDYYGMFGDYREEVVSQ